MNFIKLMQDNDYASKSLILFKKVTEYNLLLPRPKTRLKSAGRIIYILNTFTTVILMVIIMKFL